MPDWLTITLQTLPAILWIIAGVGLPWALVILPRRDWQDRVMVACLSLAFGPALLTAWMFILGTLGQNTDPDAGSTLNPMQTTPINHVGGQNLLRPETILAGTLALAIIGYAFVWWKWRTSAKPTQPPRQPLATDEKVLILLIVLATAGRWFITSWLPFGSWDPLWVYGYQGRIYTLTGYIPADIGYYPQFLPLQYAYAQIVASGEIADHAARAMIPFLQIGSILATYLLGSRLFNRRTGIFAAALWALHPHFGYWTRIGDLEIPLTFSFTGAAAFFLMSWLTQERFLRRRYALIAGLFFGVAMWTKPTAGAFIWAVILVVVVDFVRVRGDLHAWLPRFEVAALTGLASIPLGAVWYVRNMLIGHDAIVFPPSFWLTQAQRSGAEFGWPLLALALLLAYLYVGPVKFRPDWRGGLVGVILIALGVLPSIIAPSRMELLEWLALMAGVAVLAATIADTVFSHYSHLSDFALRAMRTVGWASLLALPYFVTWFYSYSYHYRLSFPIVPLMILPSAVILAGWFTPGRINGWRFPLRVTYAAVTVLIALPGVMIAVYDEGLGWDWLWTIPPEDDFSKAGLLGVVHELEQFVEETGESPVVIAPGLQPLPFFFPQADIRVVETPRTLYEADGATHFIGGRLAGEQYTRNSDSRPFRNQFWASLFRENVARQIATYDDDAFSYNVYHIDTSQRFEPIETRWPEEREVVFGEFARLVGHNVSTSRLDGGLVIDLVWQSLTPTETDYNIYLHLIKPDAPDDPYINWDTPAVPTEFGYYSTQFWEPGEIIIDTRIIFPYEDIPPSDDYQLRVGFYDLQTGDRVPVTVDGQPIGDGYTIGRRFLYQVEGE